MKVSALADVVIELPDAAVFVEPDHGTLVKVSGFQVRGDSIVLKTASKKPRPGSLTALMTEQHDLLQRIEKLREFMNTEEFCLSAEGERRDLKEQVAHYTEAYYILLRRVSRRCGCA